MRRIFIFIGALLIAGAFWRPAEAQRATVSNLAGESLTPRHLARGTLWHSFLSTGAEGLGRWKGTMPASIWIWPIRGSR